MSKGLSKDAAAMVEHIKKLEKSLDEQCRLNGMGAQRELGLMTERDALRGALTTIRDMAKESWQGQPNSILRFQGVAAWEIADKALSGQGGPAV